MSYSNQNDLIKRLRTCPAEERKDIAFQLASTRSDWVVEELIRISDAGVKSYTPRSISTLWLRLPIRYDSMDQDIAIEALGQTGSKRALEHLENLYKYTTRGYHTNYRGNLNLIYVNLNVVEEVGALLTFPNARGDLKKRLGVKIWTYKVVAGGLSGTTPYHETVERQSLEMGLAGYETNVIPYYLIAQSIKRLKEETRE